MSNFLTGFAILLYGNAVRKEWREDEHPRHSAGSEQGGEFAAAQTEEALRAVQTAKITPLSVLRKKYDIYGDWHSSSKGLEERILRALDSLDAPKGDYSVLWDSSGNTLMDVRYDPHFKKAKMRFYERTLGKASVQKLRGLLAHELTHIDMFNAVAGVTKAQKAFKEHIKSGLSMSAIKEARRVSPYAEWHMVQSTGIFIKGARFAKINLAISETLAEVGRWRTTHPARYARISQYWRTAYELLRASAARR